MSKGKETRKESKGKQPKDRPAGPKGKRTPKYEQASVNAAK